MKLLTKKPPKNNVQVTIVDCSDFRTDPRIILCSHEDFLKWSLFARDAICWKWLEASGPGMCVLTSIWSLKFIAAFEEKDGGNINSILK